MLSIHYIFKKLKIGRWIRIIRILSWIIEHFSSFSTSNNVETKTLIHDWQTFTKFIFIEKYSYLFHIKFIIWSICICSAVLKYEKIYFTVFCSHLQNPINFNKYIFYRKRWVLFTLNAIKTSGRAMNCLLKYIIIILISFSLHHLFWHDWMYQLLISYASSLQCWAVDKFFFLT